MQSVLKSLAFQKSLNGSPSSELRKPLVGLIESRVMKNLLLNSDANVPAKCALCYQSVVFLGILLLIFA
ncbi:hypothetical protein NIES4075_00960 [Tolypothrix sp. NIES-4075]|nr:hypothetical protein NIES4075_00960 [Tolypothrix sp. NIES-4075]